MDVAKLSHDWWRIENSGVGLGKENVFEFVFRCVRYGVPRVNSENKPPTLYKASPLMCEKVRMFNQDAGSRKQGLTHESKEKNVLRVYI